MFQNGKSHLKINWKSNACQVNWFFSKSCFKIHFRCSDSQKCHLENKKDVLSFQIPGIWRYNDCSKWPICLTQAVKWESCCVVPLGYNALEFKFKESGPKRLGHRGEVVHYLMAPQNLPFRGTPELDVSGTLNDSIVCLSSRGWTEWAMPLISHLR